MFLQEAFKKMTYESILLRSDLYVCALIFHNKLFLWLSLHEKSCINIFKNVVFDVSCKKETVYSLPQHEGMQISIVQVNCSFNSVLLQSSRSPVVWFCISKALWFGSFTVAACPAARRLEPCQSATTPAGIFPYWDNVHIDPGLAGVTGRRLRLGNKQVKY